MVHLSPHGCLCSADLLDHGERIFREEGVSLGHAAASGHEGLHPGRQFGGRRAHAERIEALRYRRERRAEEGKLPPRPARLGRRPDEQLGVALGIDDDDGTGAADGFREDHFQEPGLAASRGAANEHVADQLAPRQDQRLLFLHADGVQGRVTAPHVTAHGKRLATVEVRLQFTGVLGRPAEAPADEDPRVGIEPSLHARGKPAEQGPGHGPRHPPLRTLESQVPGLDRPACRQAPGAPPRPRLDQRLHAHRHPHGAADQGVRPQARIQERQVLQPYVPWKYRNETHRQRRDQETDFLFHSFASFTNSRHSRYW